MNMNINVCMIDDDNSEVFELIDNNLISDLLQIL